MVSKSRHSASPAITLPLYPSISARNPAIPPSRCHIGMLAYTATTVYKSTFAEKDLLLDCYSHSKLQILDFLYKTIPQNRPRVYVENLQTNATVQHPPIFSNLDSYQVNNNNSNKKNASPIRRPQQHHLASGQSHRLPRRSPPCPSPPPTPRPHPPALTTHRRRLELLPGRHPHANLLARRHPRDSHLSRRSHQRGVVRMVASRSAC